MVGVPPVAKDTPAEIVAVITKITNETFLSGMGLAFTVAGIVAAFAAGIAFLTKRGVNADAAGGGVHI